MEIEGKHLTSEMHGWLKSEGYRYWLINEVQINPDTGNLFFLSLTPVKQIPAVMRQSCTGIDDGMIVSLINKQHVEIVLARNSANII